MSNAYYDYLLTFPELWKAYSLRDQAQLIKYANKPAPYYVNYNPNFDAAEVVINAPGNSLLNQVRLPLGTSDNHKYTIIWDTHYTDSYKNVLKFNHKLFQFTSGGGDGHAIWLENDITYTAGVAGSVGRYHMRSMQEKVGPADWLLSDGNSRGPSSTDFNPLSPSSNFDVFSNRWTRTFVEIDQRFHDYDYINTWLADEIQDPFKVVHNVPVSVRPTGPNPNSITQFWAPEANTSTNTNVRLGDTNRPLIFYVRNVVVLIDLVDISKVLLKPKETVKPSKPSNARMI